MRASLETAVFSATLVLLAGCSTFRELPEAWAQRSLLESERFSVETDVPAELVPRTLQLAEAVRAELVDQFGGLQPPRIHLLVFADQYDFGRYHGASLPSRRQLDRERRAIEDSGHVVLGTVFETPAGHYRRGLNGKNEVAVFYQSDFEGALRHELAHVFLHESMGRPPPWLDEGVAELARLRHDARETGRTLSRLRTLDREGHAPDLEELVKMGQRRLYENSEVTYAVAWLLVRHLVEIEQSLDLEHPDRGEALGRELAGRATIPELLEAASAPQQSR